jgi:hypothetical protein
MNEPSCIALQNVFSNIRFFVSFSSFIFVTSHRRFHIWRLRGTAMKRQWRATMRDGGKMRRCKTTMKDDGRERRRRTTEESMKKSDERKRRERTTGENDERERRDQVKIVHSCMNAYAFSRWFKSFINKFLHMRSIEDSTGWMVNESVGIKSAVEWLLDGHGGFVNQQISSMNR